MRILTGIVLSIFISTLAHASSFTLSSTGFSDNGKIPAKYTCNGNNIPPTLSWIKPPANTQSFVLIVFDPNAGIGQPFYNWVLYNIPKTTNSIEELADLPIGTLVGNNTYGEANYSGPCPVDSRIHHYVFMLYALDTTLDLPEEPDIDDVLAEIVEHVLASAKLTGTFSH